jgi:hypothetical protein
VTDKFNNLILVGRAVPDEGYYHFGFGWLQCDSNKDFEQDTDHDYSFETIIKTAHTNFGDVSREKGTPYAHFIFNRVEDNAVGGDDIDLNQGGCLMRYGFDYSNSSNYAKYGTFRSIYFPDKYTYSLVGGGDPGQEAVEYKCKLRGKGKAVQFEFKNDGDRPFHLYGWQLLVRGYVRE